MRYVGAAMIFAVGLIGVYYKVEHSGWAIFCGVMVALS